MRVNGSGSQGDVTGDLLCLCRRHVAETPCAVCEPKTFVVSIAVLSHAARPNVFSADKSHLDEFRIGFGS